MKRLLSPWLLVTALAIACGCSKSVTTPGPGPAPGTRFVTTFSDLDWLRGQYFLLHDPNNGALAVDENSIRVYRDDANAGNDHEIAPCVALLDPDGALGQPLTPEQADASVRGNFDLLTPGPDRDYEILHDLFAFHDTTYKVIRLTRPIAMQSNEVLAVSFRARRMLGNGMLGPLIDVGGRRLDAGPDSGSIVVKLLRVPRTLERATPDGLTYDPNSPLAPARELELKNIYSLGAFNIDPAFFTLTLQHGQNDPPVTSQAGVPFIEMLGLDSWREVSGSYVAGHDGRIDAIGYNTQDRGRIDYTNGLLILPDFRPFAPRLDGPSAMAFDRFLDQHVNRRLRLGGPGAPSPSSPDLYSLFNPRVYDSAWYFTASWQAPASRAAN